MAEGTPDVTLGTLHDDLTDLKGEMGGLKAEMGGLRADVRALFTDLRATVIAGFANMPTRDQSDEMLRIVRENNRIHEERLARLDATVRTQHLETQQALHALADAQRGLSESQQRLIEENRALLARIDAIIRRRNNGGPSDSATS
jgi:hypothetical protein